MNDILYMVMALIAGLLIGTLFFGGLRLSVKKAVVSKIPALWFVGSFFLRMSIAMIGFYYISLGSWQRLLICLLGFVAARLIITHLVKSNEEKHIPLKKEISHET